MKKFKLTSDKLLLILGGAGIVIAVAVIVFLISFSFGSGDDEQPQKETAPANEISDGTLDGFSGEGEESAENVTEGLSQVEDVAIDNACRDSLKAFTDCFIYGDASQLERLLPFSEWEKIATHSNCTADQLIAVLQQGLSQNSVSSQVDEGTIVKCDTNSVLVVEDATAEEIRSALSSRHGISEDAFGDVYAVSMALEYVKNGEAVKEIDELFCVNINGVWYPAERDCLAVSYLLGV